jgi:hypothetical protein
VTDRRPPSARIESWVERRIREAIERGEFDGLPGTGKPLAGLDGPHDDLWWVKQKMRREGLSLLPPALALRKEAEDGLAAAMAARTESEARRHVETVNQKIREALRRPPAGPPVDLVPLDVERVLEQWRTRHPRS